MTERRSWTEKYTSLYHTTTKEGHKQATANILYLLWNHIDMMIIQAHTCTTFFYSVLTFEMDLHVSTWISSMESTALSSHHTKSTYLLCCWQLSLGSRRRFLSQSAFSQGIPKMSSHHPCKGSILRIIQSFWSPSWTVEAYKRSQKANGWSPLPRRDDQPSTAHWTSTLGQHLPQSPSSFQLLEIKPRGLMNTRNTVHHWAMPSSPFFIYKTVLWKFVMGIQIFGRTTIRQKKIRFKTLMQWNLYIKHIVPFALFLKLFFVCLFLVIRSHIGQNGLKLKVL